MTATTAARPSTSPAERRADYGRFVAYVLHRCEEPASRAALRSGVRRSVNEAPRMHRVIAGQVPEGQLPSVEQAFYSVAALIAAQPRQARDEERARRDAARTAKEQGDSSATAEGPGAEAASSTSGTAESAHRSRRERRNFGATLAEAVKTRAFTRDNAEAHVHLLTRQGVRGIHRHLPGVVSHLRADQVQVDWVLLLDDLARWEWYRPDVAKEWLQAFYRGLEPEADNDDSAKADAPPTGDA